MILCTPRAAHTIGDGAVTERTSSYIGGQWVRSAGCTFTCVNPADTADVIGPYYAATAPDLNMALIAASKAARNWGECAPAARGEVLQRAAAVARARAEKIARSLTREEGKTIAEAKAEIVGAAQILEYLGAGGLWGSDGRISPSSRPTTLLYTRRYPLGVVAIITPWNFPFSNPALKIGAALMAGNAVAWKPSPWTPATAIALIECFIEAGLPDGTVNTLLDNGVEIAKALVGDERVNAVSFTGSTATGRAIAASVGPRMVPLQLEMGGKNAVVVLEDASIDKAAFATARAAFLSVGQKCTAASRAIVVSRSKKQFLEALVAETQSLRVGPPMDPGIDVGPVVHERQLAKHIAALDALRSRQARIVAGGERLGADLVHGYYLAPTVVDGVAPTDRFAREELFGPFLAVMEARNYEEALTFANDSTYGLSASIFTHDLPRAFDFAHRCEAGMVKINEGPTGTDFYMPVGGWKDSGAGAKELGPRATEFFSREKTVSLNHLSV